VRQIFIDGFYHADPHTGNIFIDEENGIIYFIDVGSAAQLSFKNRYILYKLLRALESGNRKKVAKIVADMTGNDSPDLTRKVQRIANSESNVIEKLISTYQLLEDSGIALDPEQMSIFRCFAQGELLFKSSLTSPVSGAGLFGAGTEAEFHEGVMGQGDVDASQAEVLVSQVEPLLESLEVPLSGSQSFTFEINDQNRTVEVTVDNSLEEMFEINHNGTVIKINPDKVKERFGDKADVDTIIQAIIVHEIAEALGKQLGYNHNTRHTASLILEGLLASTAPTVREALVPLWQARPVAFGAGDVWQPLRHPGP
jgi:serine/threonine protein kinase